MATTTTTTNKPLNPRAQDLSPKGYNRAALFSGKALDFDGVNDILTLPTALTSSLSTTSVTFATYVYPDFTTWSGDRDDVFSFNERGVILAFNGGNIYYYFRHESSGWDGLQVPNAAVTMQAWNHMVVTIDLGTDQYKAYVNGKLVASAGTTRASIEYEGNALTIGAQAGARFFDGKIAGFKVFNTALTAAQVADLYLNPEKITPDGVATSALKLWLPMMEGAGASAYDGSGNGNDGTINGATWTAGVGAPVAQTALVSWNKGTNRLLYSEALDNAAWQKANATITSNAATAPNGTTTADQITSTSTSIENYTRQDAGVGISAGTTLTTMAYAKKGTHTFFRMRNLFVNNGGADGNAWYNLDTGAVATIQSGQTATMTAVGDGWYLCTLTGTIGTTGTALLVDLGTATTDGSNVPTTNGSTFVWGASNYVGAVGAPYIKTNATAQTSAVLVPEGLTAGASIFGTDIITPRNAFALNLDGASWAQVGDNASLDFGSGEFSFEAWANFGLNDNQQTIFQKGDAGIGSARGINLFRTTANLVRVIITADSEVTIIGPSVTISTWNHVVITKDASNVKMYINGVYNSQVGSPAGTINVDTPLRIGTFNNAQYISGAIANPRIYNRALTAAEVLRNYNADKAKFGL